MRVKKYRADTRVDVKFYYNVRICELNYFNSTALLFVGCKNQTR